MSSGFRILGSEKSSNLANATKYSRSIELAERTFKFNWVPAGVLTQLLFTRLVTSGLPIFLIPYVDW